jgi:hypothetical protein
MVASPIPAIKTGVSTIAGVLNSGREEVSSRVGTALPTPISAGEFPRNAPRLKNLPIQSIRRQSPPEIGQWIQTG